MELLLDLFDAPVGKQDPQTDLGVRLEESDKRRGRGYSSPQETGSVTESSPRGSRYSPAAACSASCTCSMMRRAAATWTVTSGGDLR